eukprot:m.73599 g.73599  ORF g.73599 m.73599 type:complete len:182 (+) comp12426_c0_seq2:740-1285(+)
MAQPDLQEIAKNAVTWILGTVKADGTIPYILTPTRDNSHTLYQPISYSTESFIDVGTRYKDMTGPLRDTLKRTVDFLVKNQSADGTWGFWKSPGCTQAEVCFDPTGDAQRSPRVLSLLQWYNQVPDANVTKAIEKYADFLAVPSNQEAYRVAGTHALALPAGFVGLAIADLMKPWCTFHGL